MNKKTEGKILDIAAEVLVSPLAAFVKAVEIKKAVAGSETYEKTKEAAKSAGKDIKGAAKKAYESEPVQKGIGAVKGTAKKVSESEAYKKAKSGAEKGVAAAKEGVKGAMNRLGFTGASTEEEPEEEAMAEEAEEKEEPSKEEGIEDVIDGVDLSGIITEEEGTEDVL